MAFLTRADVEYNTTVWGTVLSQEGYAKFANWVPCNSTEEAGSLIWKGRGIMRYLYGKMNEQTAKLTKVQQGVAKHAEVESGQAESLAAKAVQAYVTQLEQAGYACHKEVFLAGEIAGKPVLGYADCIACNEQGDAKLIDWKFTMCPDRLIAVPQMHHNYVLALVGYSFLVSAMYGAKMRELELAAVHAETGEISFKTWQKGDLAQYWIELNQRLADAPLKC